MPAGLCSCNRLFLRTGVGCLPNDRLFVTPTFNKELGPSRKEGTSSACLLVWVLSFAFGPWRHTKRNSSRQGTLRETTPKKLLTSPYPKAREKRCSSTEDSVRSSDCCLVYLLLSIYVSLKCTSINKLLYFK